MRFYPTNSWCGPAWICVLGILQTLACQSPATPHPSPTSEVQDPVLVLDLDGDPLDIFAKDKRHDVLLFLRTDCPISNRYAPTYARIAARLAEQPVDLWRVYVDPDETPAMIRAHAKEYRLPGRALRDPTHALANALGITVTPEAVVLDAQGVKRYRGRIDNWYADYGTARARPTTADLSDAVQAVVRGEMPEVPTTTAIGCPLPTLQGATTVKGDSIAPAPLPGADGVTPSRVTFTEHVAPIVYARCAPCHRPDQVAPFSLLNEGDLRDHAEQIAEVTASRFMPPWKPVRGHGEFVGDRSLTDAQIAIFRAWVDAGLPSGPDAARKAAPSFPHGWLAGTPDIILELPEAYVVPAEGLDIYRNFVLPATVDGRVWVKGWELDPGNHRVVHHAILSLDQRGSAVAADAADPGPGFTAMEPRGLRSPGGSYLVWTPGLIAVESKHVNAWSLQPDAQLVLQLHLQPSGKQERVAPRVGLFLGTRPTKTGLTLRVGDVPLNIKAGDSNYAAKDSLVLAADIELLSVFPHAHYLARTFECDATLPNGTTRDLLRIDDWDFAWQDQYRYRDPVQLPAGTVINMQVSYDNSADNPRNPSTPPVTVVHGPSSTDEMGNITLEVVPKDKQGLLALREAKYRRAIARGAGGTQHYNLGNVLRDRGDANGAVEHYQKALTVDPEHHWTLHNLSMVLQQLGQHEEAVAVARREAAVTPQSADAYNNLGNALKGAGQREAAIEAIRRAIELDPKNAMARNNLMTLGVQN